MSDIEKKYHEEGNTWLENTADGAVVGGGVALGAGTGAAVGGPVGALIGGILGAWGASKVNENINASREESRAKEHEAYVSTHGESAKYLGIDSPNVYVDKNGNPTSSRNYAYFETQPNGRLKLNISKSLSESEDFMDIIKSDNFKTAVSLYQQDPTAKVQTVDGEKTAADIYNEYMDGINGYVQTKEVVDKQKDDFFKSYGVKPTDSEIVSALTGIITPETSDTDAIIVAPVIYNRSNSLGLKDLPSWNEETHTISYGDFKEWYKNSISNDYQANDIKSLVAEHLANMRSKGRDFKRDSDMQKWLTETDEGKEYARQVAETWAFYRSLAGTEADSTEIAKHASFIAATGYSVISGFTNGTLNIIDFFSGRGLGSKNILEDSGMSSAALLAMYTKDYDVSDFQTKEDLERYIERVSQKTYGTLIDEGGPGTVNALVHKALWDTTDFLRDNLVGRDRNLDQEKVIDASGVQIDRNLYEKLDSMRGQSIAQMDVGDMTERGYKFGQFLYKTAENLLILNAAGKAAQNVVTKGISKVTGLSVTAAEAGQMMSAALTDSVLGSASIATMGKIITSLAASYKAVGLAAFAANVAAQGAIETIIDTPGIWSKLSKGEAKDLMSIYADNVFWNAFGEAIGASMNELPRNAIDAAAEGKLGRAAAFTVNKAAQYKYKIGAVIGSKFARTAEGQWNAVFKRLQSDAARDFAGAALESSGRVSAMERVTKLTAAIEDGESAKMTGVEFRTNSGRSFEEIQEARKNGEKITYEEALLTKVQLENIYDAVRGGTREIIEKEFLSDSKNRLAYDEASNTTAELKAMGEKLGLEKEGSAEISTDFYTYIVSRARTSYLTNVAYKNAVENGLIKEVKADYDSIDAAQAKLSKAMDEIGAKGETLAEKLMNSDLLSKELDQPRMFEEFSNKYKELITRFAGTDPSIVDSLNAHYRSLANLDARTIDWAVRLGIMDSAELESLRNSGLWGTNGQLWIKTVNGGGGATYEDVFSSFIEGKKTRETIRVNGYNDVYHYGKASVDDLFMDPTTTALGLLEKNARVKLFNDYKKIAFSLDKSAVYITDEEGFKAAKDLGGARGEDAVAKVLSDQMRDEFSNRAQRVMKEYEKAAPGESGNFLAKTVDRFTTTVDAMRARARGSDSALFKGEGTKIYSDSVTSKKIAARLSDYELGVLADEVGLPRYEVPTTLDGWKEMWGTFNKNQKRSVLKRAEELGIINFKQEVTGYGLRDVLNAKRKRTARIKKATIDELPDDVVRAFKAQGGSVEELKQAWADDTPMEVYTVKVPFGADDTALRENYPRSSASMEQKYQNEEYNREHDLREDWWHKNEHVLPLKGLRKGETYIFFNEKDANDFAYNVWNPRNEIIEDRAVAQDLIGEDPDAIRYAYMPTIKKQKMTPHMFAYDFYSNPRAGAYSGSRRIPESFWNGEGDGFNGVSADAPLKYDTTVKRTADFYKKTGPLEADYGTVELYSPSRKLDGNTDLYVSRGYAKNAANGKPVYKHVLSKESVKFSDQNNVIFVKRPYDAKNLFSRAVENLSSQRRIAIGEDERRTIHGLSTKQISEAQKTGKVTVYSTKRILKDDTDIFLDKDMAKSDNGYTRLYTHEVDLDNVRFNEMHDTQNAKFFHTKEQIDDVSMFDGELGLQSYATIAAQDDTLVPELQKEYLMRSTYKNKETGKYVDPEGENVAKIKGSDAYKKIVRDRIESDIEYTGNVLMNKWYDEYQKIAGAKNLSEMTGIKEVDLTRREFAELIIDLTDELVDGVTNEFFRVSRDGFSKEALGLIESSLNRMGGGRDLYKQYLVLNSLSEEQTKAIVDKMCSEYVDGSKLAKKLALTPKDRSIYKRTLSGAIMERLETVNNQTTNALKEMGHFKMMDAENFYKRVGKYASDIEGKMVDPTPQAITKIYDSNGKAHYVKMDPVYAGMVEYVAAMDMSNGPIYKFFRATNRMFRFGTTVINPSGVLNQYFKDYGNSFLATGFLLFNDGTASKFFGKDVSFVASKVFEEEIGDDLVRMYKDTYGEESMNIWKAQAERENKSLKQVIIENEVNRGASIDRGTLGETEFFREGKRAQRNFYDKIRGRVTDGDVKQSDTILGKKIKESNDGLLDKVREGVDKISINQNREHFLRQANYMKKLNEAIRNGKSLFEARELAERFSRDATTDFSRSFMFANNWIRHVPYLGAAFNGAASFMRLLELDPVRISSRIMLAGLAFARVNTISMSNEENRKLYKNLTEYQKDGKLVWVDNGAVFTIPIPEELSTFVNVIRHTIEKANGESKNSWFQLVAHDLLSLSPVDIDGFMDLDANTIYQQRDFGENIFAGFLSVAGSLLPATGKTALMAAFGKDPYTGIDIDRANYGYKVDENGDLQLMDNTESKLAQTFHSIFPNTSASAADYLIKSILGAGTKSILDGVLAALSGDPNGALKTLDKAAFGGIFPTIYDQQKSDWKDMINRKYQEKYELLYGTSGRSGEKTQMQALIQKLNKEDDPEKREKIMAQIRNIQQPFIQSVLDEVNALRKKYGDNMYTYNRQAALVNLLTFGENYEIASNQFAKNAASTGYYNARDLSIQTMVRYGFPTVKDDVSIFGHGYYDENGEYQFKANSPVAIMDAESVMYSQSKFAVANMEAALTASGIKSLKDAVKAKRDEIYAKHPGTNGKRSSADWNAINKALDAIYADYNSKAMEVILPYIKDYAGGVDEFLNYNWKTLNDWIMVPNSAMGKGKYDSDVQKNPAYVKSYVKFLLEEVYND